MIDSSAFLLIPLILYFHTQQEKLLLQVKIVKIEELDLVAILEKKEYSRIAKKPELEIHHIDLKLISYSKKEQN